MFLSKRATGVYYLFYFDELGKRHKVSTHCRHKSDALKFLQQFKETEHFRKARLQRVSLSQFAEDYLNYSKAVHTAKSQESIRTSLREFIRIVGDIPLHSASVREIENFLGVKKCEASERTARTYFVTLASAFEAAKRWNCIRFNPFRQVEKPKLRELQPAHFSKPEFQSLLRVVQESDFRDLYLCGVLSGLRLGELTSLQWTDVDFIRKVVHVRNSDTFTTKSKKNRVVPMTEQVWQVLAARKENAACELVFHRNGNRLTKDYVSKRFKRYVRLAGLNEKLHFHSLRHTFASWLVQDGASIYEVQRLLGHSSIAMTQVYSHLQPEQLHSTVNRIAVSLN